MKDLLFLNKYLWNYRWYLLWGIVFVALSNLFRVLQPQVIREALDLVYENLRIYRLYDGFQLQDLVFGSIGKTLLLFGLLVIALALLMGIFMYFMRQTIIVMSRLIEYDLRKEIYNHYQELDLAFYKRNMTGDLMARITEDVSKVRMYLGPAILYGINLVTLFVMVIYSMFSVNAELALYCLLPLPFLSLSIYFVSSIIHQKSTIIQQQLSRLNSLAQEVFSGIRVVKSYSREKQLGEYFSEECEDYKEKSLKLVRVNALFFPLMLLIIGASTILTIFFGGLQAYKGNVTPGNIAEFVIYVNMLTWPVTALGWIASIIQQAAASQKRINEFLAVKPEVRNTSDSNLEIVGEIEFRNVSFTYPDTGIQALNDVSFQLNKGQKMAIVGRTGSGKSTIADLILRMFDPQEGLILIDGTDIREHNLYHLREQIGYVPQDIFLFSDTIDENIAFGLDETNHDRNVEYARKAAVYDDIMTLPDKFDAMVGERGVNLSGGQKQRITIARSFIKNPEIVILDDSLSAVDTNTENQILQYLQRELHDKTTIIITHRIYGLLDYDKIIVMHRGTVAEQGTHEELLRENGYYARLYERQQVQREND